jgi:hypothetical protein
MIGGETTIFPRLHHLNHPIFFCPDLEIVSGSSTNHPSGVSSFSGYGINPGTLSSDFLASGSSILF